MLYIALKHIHLTTILLSFALFLIRGGLSFMLPALLQKKALKVLPHIIDTLLLLSAAGLAITLQQYPFVDHWLTAKLIALVAYIVLGVIAMKQSKPVLTRLVAFLGAIAAFAYIVGVAITHNPLSWSAGF